jgi:electron transfer flavoprotein alpha subunit
MSDILVYAQLDDGRLHDVALQCLAAARTLAGVSGAKVRALTAGPGAAAAASAAISAGADEVLTADDPALSPVLAAPHVALLKDAVQSTGASLVLLPSTTTGNDLAPLLAAALDAACILDADAVALKDGRPVFQRLEFDRKALSSYAAKGTVVATLRDGVAPNPASDASRTGKVTPVASPAAASRSKVVRRDVTGHTVNLRAAKIIVAPARVSAARTTSRRSRNWRPRWAPRWAPPARWSTQAGCRPTTRSARPAPPCARPVHRRAASAARSSTGSASCEARASSPSTATRTRR